MVVKSKFAHKVQSKVVTFCNIDNSILKPRNLFVPEKMNYLCVTVDIPIGYLGRSPKIRLT